MQLMRWSITRRLECRGIRQSQEKSCQPTTRIYSSRSSGEENDFISDGEESGGGGGGGDEAVDLTAARTHHGDEDEKDQEDPLEEDEEGVDEQDEQDEDEEGSRKQMHHRQDAENNNNFVEGGASSGIFPPAGTSHVTLEALQNTKVAVAQFAATALAGGADSEAALQDLALLQSTLYTLQHQQVFQLQLISQLQQQLSITHGQSVPQSSTTEPPNSKEASPSPVLHPKALSTLTSPPSCRSPSSSSHRQQSSPAPATPNLPQERPTPSSSASPLNLPLQATTPNVSSSIPTTSNNSSNLALSHQMPPLCSISSSLASSIITNTDPPPLHEPNTLEMLQKRAQEVLDNASQGLLANNLADELAFRGGKGSRLSPYDSKSGGSRGEHFFKHRCRYCGKVFGSDSALQIHIRSHTGERPFKCNVCGSRFTTKGNLKVHFQRHTAKFPHVKMNPNPVPEHLDKYHPPLLQQIASGQRPMPSPPPPPPSHHPSFHPAATAHGFLPPQPPLPLSLALPGMPPLYRSPIINHRDDQELPENLSKPNVTTVPTATSPLSPAALSNSHHSSFHDNHQQQQQKQQLEQEEIKMEQRSPLQEQYPQRPTSRDGTDRITPKKEPEDTEEPVEEETEDFEETTRRYLASPPSSANPPSQPQTYEDCSMDSKISGRLEADGDMEVDEETEEQPENLSSRGTAGRLPQQIVAYPGASPASSSASSGSVQTSFAGILFPGPPAHHQIPHHTVANASVTPTVSAPEMIVDPAKDPAIYSSLLPRPGSNDNSWESLIEITKTSETSKLQQLVDNIEHKLTDPNQCVICHRVLSCKSALQMHYRTHTGERPFKCKICGRAFTTKGNLKTHMGVHRAKPQLRVFHQCPVCHKKFTNALVLQQHIRLHTGEPTDLSLEQIQADEVNEFPPGYSHHPLASFLPQGFPPIHPTSAGFSLGFPPSRQPTIERQHQKNDMDVKEEPQQQQHQQQQQQQHQLLHHQQQQQQQQQQRYMEEHNEEVEEQEDEEEDRREDDERCEVNRDRCIPDTEEEQDHENEESEQKEISLSTFSTSLAALENQVRTITTTATGTASNVARSPSYHRYNGSDKSNSPPTGGAPLDLTPRASSTPASVSSAATPPPQTTPHHAHPFGMFAGLLQTVSSSPSTSTMGSSSSINSVTSMNTVAPGSGASGPLASLTTSAVLAATSTYNPLGLAVGGPAVRGNTTCNICYKTFACNSALEIHYRSHTKERPFKCSICDRGFSTKNAGSDVCSSCAEQRKPFTIKGTPQTNNRYQSEERRTSTSGNEEKPKRRRRRPEERKNRGRTGTGGGRGLTSIYSTVRLPPLMPPALGLLTSDHVFLVRDSSIHRLHPMSTLTLQRQHETTHADTQNTRYATPPLHRCETTTPTTKPGPREF
uniref:homeotic protein spalt-major-like isoform X6 n=1 Tax=Vespula vulgaris TaxID=7454 RepID=UPI00223BBE5B|nr:homeotic protein spalt-major-like isoform X6 [Vespula vulgaris]